MSLHAHMPKLLKDLRGGAESRFIPPRMQFRTYSRASLNLVARCMKSWGCRRKCDRLRLGMWPPVISPSGVACPPTLGPAMSHQVGGIDLALLAGLLPSCSACRVRCIGGSSHHCVCGN